MVQNDRSSFCSDATGKTPPHGNSNALMDLFFDSVSSPCNQLMRSWLELQYGRRIGVYQLGDPNEHFNEEIFDVKMLEFDSGQRTNCLESSVNSYLFLRRRGWHGTTLWPFLVDNGTYHGDRDS
jgi:hypothetical protein